MRSFSALIVLCIVTAAAGQEPKPKLATTPLTLDQIAVYRAFLSDYNAGSKGALNVADITDTFEPDTDSMLSSDNRRDDCLRQFPAKIHASEVHLLPDSLATAHVRLVDPAKHKIADPGDAIHSPADVDSAVEAGFAAALMTLSEVVFDTQRHRAAFSYSFVCGRLCGNGGIVIYNLQNGHWTRSSRRCGSWVS
jgi:hypothetical protein